VAPAPAHQPGPQGKQTAADVAPVALLAVAAAQGTQLSGERAPTAEEKVPLAQGVQKGEPGVEAQLPAAQATHVAADVAPTVALAVPTGHCAQEVAREEAP